MAKKRKKNSKNKQNAAGNSRVSVLTEDKDTYNPFKDISSVKVEKLKKSKSKTKTKNDGLVVEKLVEEVTFAEIFEQWEKGGVVTPKKNKTAKQKDKNKEDSKQDDTKEDFSKIFDKWERQQGIKQKPKQKVKKELNRKVSKYNPTIDFGELLDEFETGKSTKVEKVKVKEKTVQEKIIDTKSNTDISREKQVLDKGSLNKKTEKNLEPKKDSSKEKNIAWSAKRKVQNDFPKNKKEDNVNLNIDKKSVNSDNKRVNSLNSSKVSIKENESSKTKPVVKNKWDFSDIYSKWESKNDETTHIEAKKRKEKSECKGISISYLRSMKPEAEIDLHGLTGDIAALKVSEFLASSRNKGLRKVSIITGKGIHSENGKAILKNIALEEIKSSNIVREAYHPKAVHGGKGAIWVIFKSTTGKKIYY